MCCAPSSAWFAITALHCAPSTVMGSLTVASSTPASTIAAGGESQPATAAMARLAAAARQSAVDLTLTFPFLRILSFVPRLLAVYQRQLRLHASLLLVERQRHQRV